MQRIDQLLADMGERHKTPQDHVVVVPRRLRHRATCSCGWEAGKRVFLGAAKVDALLHAADTGHEPAVPLVVRNSRS
jgi:hypothetical protein